MQKRFLAKERLNILRAADGQRQWYSLNDKRKCVVCDRIITGSQIGITRDRHGHYLLKCPTPGCPSTVNHWFLCELSPNRHVTSRSVVAHDFSFLEQAI